MSPRGEIAHPRAPNKTREEGPVNPFALKGSRRKCHEKFTAPEPRGSRDARAGFERFATLSLRRLVGKLGASSQKRSLPAAWLRSSSLLVSSMRSRLRCFRGD